MPFYGAERRAYQQKRRNEWRIRVVTHLGGCCVVCGSVEGLEIHHKDPAQKEFNLSQIWSHRWSKQLLELEKCELRCSDHHKEVHESLHGTERRYKNGCRCEPCVEVYRKIRRKHSAKYRADGRDKTRKNYAGLAGGS